jgi:halimadienyl-diphosphate synthase
MNYVQEAKELVRNLNQRMSPSAYDIAWMARLRTSANGGARWPDLIEWLLENQYPDGNWGGQIVYYHDRIICTLAAAIALHENGDTSQAQQAVRQAERYLWRHLHKLPHDPFELSGFELILPTLLDEARTLGLDVPTHTCGYGDIQTTKLRLIPPHMLYSSHISTVYSLEFLGRAGEPDRLRQAINSSGSVGNSPATTAYYLSLCNHNGDKDEQALAYLETVREQNRMITVYPFHVFELGWVLNNLIYSSLSIEAFADQAMLDRLYTALGPTGIALDPTFGIPDGDITSVCCRVLLSAGYNVDPLILANFENQEAQVFRTYDYERNLSVSTNTHALDALSLFPDYPNQDKVRKQVIITLLDNRKYNIYWVDKWHASPYYVTAHALVGLLREEDYLIHECRHTVDWILHNQHDDGSWGFFQGGTAEETAYALTALLHYHHYEPIADPDILHRGAAYLASTYQRADSIYPELWLAKSIYAPYDVIRSAILAALILYEEAFGRSL